VFGSGALRGKVVVLGAVLVCLLGAGTWIALTHAPAQAAGKVRATSREREYKKASDVLPGPFRVVSVSPAQHATGVNGGAAVEVTFSAPLTSGSPMPALRPHVAGTWQRASADTLKFTPAGGFGQHERVRLRIPDGAAGVQSARGGSLASPVTVSFRTGSYSRLRLDQLLAQLGYLPLTWSPASAGAGTQTAASNQASTASQTSTDGQQSAAAEHSAAFDPPAGTFSWKSGYPAELRHFWHGGKASSLIVKGALMAFEADHGLLLDGVAGTQVWNSLFTAATRDQVNQHGYTYAVARQKTPETLTIWHNGRKVFRSLANTGIPVSPTTVGTAPVYLRYRFQIMRGTNPDGSQYADPVDFVSYFRAGEAVHYFPRYSYGFQQSLGCVELPWNAAAKAWPYLTYGSLVSVNAP
jgi:hypothetical protein